MNILEHNIIFSLFFILAFKCGQNLSNPVFLINWEKIGLGEEDFIEQIFLDLEDTGIDEEEHEEEHVEEHWEYTGRTGTEYWGTINENCLGSSQSPINMDPTLMEVEQDRSIARIQFVNYDKVTARSTMLENNGHTVELKVLSGDPTMSGGFLTSEYQLAQLHFHWGDTNSMGSEHTINRRRFPLEMHLVHLASNIATTQQGGLAVAGFVWEITREDNPHIEAVIAAIKHIGAPHTETHLEENFKLSSLILPAVSGPYFSYQGSLTTPGCNEVVQWILFSTPLPISSRQIAAFRSVFDMDGQPIVNNFRPVQPLHDRTVTHYDNSVY